MFNDGNFQHRSLYSRSEKKHECGHKLSSVTGVGRPVALTEGSSPVGTAMAGSECFRLYSKGVIYCFGNKRAHCLNAIAGRELDQSSGAFYATADTLKFH